MEELPNLVISPPEVSRLVCSLFVHRNPDVLFLWGESMVPKLVEEAMKAGNSKATYLFCMLELLTSPHLESAEVDRVLSLLESLKEREDMVWLRATVITY